LSLEEFLRKVSVCFNFSNYKYYSAKRLIADFGALWPTITGKMVHIAELVGKFFRRRFLIKEEDFRLTQYYQL
jgi:hypothetical protein